jgi:hypothetical protein
VLQRYWQSSYPFHNMTTCRLRLRDKMARTQSSIIARSLPSLALFPSLVAGQIPPVEDGFVNIPFNAF